MATLRLLEIVWKAKVLEPLQILGFRSHPEVANQHRTYLLQERLIHQMLRIEIEDTHFRCGYQHPPLERILPRAIAIMESVIMQYLGIVHAKPICPSRPYAPALQELQYPWRQGSSWSMKVA